MKLIIDLGEDYPATVVSAIVDVVEWASLSGPEDVAKYATLEE